MRTESVGHGQLVGDAAEAVAELASVFQVLTSLGTPLTLVLDLGDRDFTTSALQAVLSHVGQALRGGGFRDTRVVFVASNPAVVEFVRLLAEANGFPFYVAASRSEIPSARPVGDLTTSEEETLDVLRRLGGRATAAELGQAMGLAPSAANNRLNALDRKGYLLRVRRHRRQGDDFLDPRAEMPSIDELRVRAIKPMGAALRAAGISSDPYSREPSKLEGEAAERAAEILRRRGLAT